MVKHELDMPVVRKKKRPGTVYEVYLAAALIFGEVGKDAPREPYEFCQDVTKVTLMYLHFKSFDTVEYSHVSCDNCINGTDGDCVNQAFRYFAPV